MTYQTRQKLEVVTIGSWALISRQNSSQLEEGSWTVNVFLHLINLVYEHSRTGKYNVCWLSKESTVKDNNVAYAEHTNLMQLPSPAACIGSPHPLFIWLSSYEEVCMFDCGTNARIQLA